MNMEPNRRRSTEADGPRTTRHAAGVPLREDDLDSTMGLHWIALLFRGLAILVFALMLMQFVFGLASPVDLSYGLLFAEAIRMLILACLLWAAGAMSDLFVQSHHDLRASRVLLARIAHRLGDEPAGATSSSAPDLRNGGTEHARYRQ